MRLMSILILVLALVLLLPDGLAAQNKYIGVKMCTMCHKTEKQGKQFDLWKAGGHANAYTTLTSDASKKIAKEKGLTKAPTEAPECLECHTLGATVDPKLFEKSFDIKDGVQCETCHNAGSAYKTNPIMKDRAKSIAAGMREFKDEAAIEAYCKTCHNPKSPTYREFKFKEMWPKIAHPVPAKG